MHGIALRGIRTNVHNDTCQAGANTAFIDRPGNTIKAIAMGKHGFEEGGSAGFQHFSDAQARAHIAIVFREVALQDPDALTQPLDQRHVISAAANQGLCQVNMCIDKSRKYQPSLHIDHFVVMILLPQSIGFTNSDNAVALNGDGSIGNDITGRVHGNDSGIGEKHGCQSPAGNARNNIRLRGKYTTKRA